METTNPRTMELARSFAGDSPGPPGWTVYQEVVGGGGAPAVNAYAATSQPETDERTCPRLWETTGEAVWEAREVLELQWLTEVPSYV